MPKSDYKTKYIDMRAKLLEATNVSYRLGYADGLKEGQQQAQQQQMQAQAEAEAAAAAQGGLPPEEGGEAPMGPDGQPMEEMPQGSMPPSDEDEGLPPGAVASAGGDEGDGSELDQHINELESLVAKGEKPSILSMRKAVQALSELRKSQKKITAKKVEKTTSSQKKFVDNILKKWEKEAQSKDVTENLEEIIKESGLEVE